MKELTSMCHHYDTTIAETDIHSPHGVSPVVVLSEELAWNHQFIYLSSYFVGSRAAICVLPGRLGHACNPKYQVSICLALNFLSLVGTRYIRAPVT